MAAADFTDFYIIDRNYNKFNETDLIEDDITKIVVQKYQMLVYTTRGDVLGDPNFGTNLMELLNETRLSAGDIENEIKNQISAYIPEVLNTPYDLIVNFEQDPENYQDIMMIYFNINDYEIVNQVSNLS